ncbi:MAG: hypothetical protein CMJ83_02665 [Planctomycetes bacterium]|nr:hypothetical protein [Planctomycetota bacterium]
MSTVHRDEILDFVTYGEKRDQIRDSAMAAKERRRVIVADVLTFLFESHETVRYQVLEMVRTEQLVKESDIQHELDTYNELLGKDGGLGCTLMIGIRDPEERDVKLRTWFGLCAHLYVKLDDGAVVRATWDDRQVGDDRLSSVQFLQFPVGGRVPVALGCDHPVVTAETQLSEDTRVALTEDIEAVS